MADKALDGQPLPFNIPDGIEAVKARDPEFWQAHAIWQAAQSEFDACSEQTDENSHAGSLFVRANTLRDAVLSTPVRTGYGLAAKLQVVQEGDTQGILTVLPSGMTVLEVIESDAGRISKFEIWGADAFEDMAEG